MSALLPQLPRATDVPSTLVPIWHHLWRLKMRAFSGDSDVSILDVNCAVILTGWHLRYREVQKIVILNLRQ